MILIIHSLVGYLVRPTHPELVFHDHQLWRVVFQFSVFPHTIMQIHVVHRHFSGAIPPLRVRDYSAFPAFPGMVPPCISCRHTVRAPWFEWRMRHLVAFPLVMGWLLWTLNNGWRFSTLFMLVLEVLCQPGLQVLHLLGYLFPWV